MTELADTESSNDADKANTVLEKFKVAHKVKVLAEIETNETEREQEVTQVLSKTSNICVKTKKDAESKIQSDLRKYKCNECNKSFQKNDSLKHHMEGVHQKLKFFQCKDCENSFSKGEKFMKHMSKVHPFLLFKCNYCTRLFAQNKGLKRHIKRLHQSQKCHLCNKAFPLTISLEKHMKNMHHTK